MYVDLYVEAERAKPVKRSKKELEAERDAREAADKLREATAIHYKLRKEFVDKISINAKNRTLLLFHLTKAITYSIVNWIGVSHGETLAQALGISEDDYIKIDHYKRFDKLIEIIKTDESLIPRVLSVYLGDNERNGYFICYESDLRIGSKPRYNGNEQLNLLYDFLCAFGYEMSDEEKAIKDGSSPYFAK